MDTAKAREPKSFPLLKSHLTNLGNAISELLRHQHALSTITGLESTPTLVPTPAPSEAPSHMERCFLDIRDFTDWIRAIDEGFAKQIGELVPEFYEKQPQPSPS